MGLGSDKGKWGLYQSKLIGSQQARHTWLVGLPSHLDMVRAVLVSADFLAANEVRCADVHKIRKALRYQVVSLMKTSKNFHLVVLECVPKQSLCPLGAAAVPENVKE